jgi:hypothetical protein
MEKNRRYRHEIYITDTESFEWYLVIFEVDERSVPLNSFIVKIPPTDAKFKIYPYLFN